MTWLYITADTIGTETGGGLVTKHECQAFFNLAASENKEAKAWQKSDLTCIRPEPWSFDWKASKEDAFLFLRPELTHFYSGTFSQTVAVLKKHGCKVTYTIAAHDRAVSQREHGVWGMGFPYDHLTQEPLWKRYIEGYRLADVIVCPSTVAANTVRRYGPDFAKKRIEIIPHGCELPETTAPLPEPFVVGYMGAISPDKGVLYLLQAWKKLSYKNALLVLAGKDSDNPYTRKLVEDHGGGNIHLAGWQRNVSDFYGGISIYIQPSSTEGFGLEVLEAMAHSRHVLCSTGAGAQDLVPIGFRFPPCDADALAEKIDAARHTPRDVLIKSGEFNRERAKNYTWDKIRTQYMDLWRSLL